MTGRTLTSAAALAFAWGSVAGVWAADGFRQLSGREVSARLTGQEFSDEHHYAEVFQRGGTLAGTYLGKRKFGSWRVAGEELCLTREQDQERCYEVWVSGQKVQLRQPGVEISDEGILRKPSARN